MIGAHLIKKANKYNAFLHVGLAGLAKKMSGGQNVWQTKCLADKMSGRQNVWRTKCLADKMSGKENVRLTKCQVDKMSG